MKPKKIWQMITVLILVIGLVMTAQPMIPAQAAPALAVSPVNTWAQQYAGAAYPAGAVNPAYIIPSGDNRLLVVAISSTRTAVGTQTVNVSYGGQALSLAAGDGTSAATWNHSYLYYLKEAGIQAASGTSLNVTITGGTSYYNWVYAAVFSGVDQSTPAAGAARNYNSATANNTVGPFNPTLTIATNDQAVEIINLARSATGTTVRSITTWAAGWGTAGIDQTYNPGGTTITAHLYIRNRNILTAANDGSQHTASSNNTWDSMSALSMKAALSQTALTITGPASVTYGTTGTITTSGGSGSGAVSYSAGSSTGCTVGSSTGVIIVTNASGTCTITAAKAADGTYNSATSAPFTVTLNRAEQAALMVTGPASLIYGTSATVAFGGGSGTGALSYSAGTSGGCAVDTSTGEVSVTDASGTCAVTVSRAGDNNFNPATSAPFTITLNRAEQAALMVTGPASLIYGTTGTLTSSGGTGTGAVTYSVGASTGCSITGGTTLNVDNASGTCDVTATKAGDNNYNPVTSTPYTVTLNHADQAALDVTGPASVTYGVNGTITTTGGSGTGAMSFSAGASTGCSVDGLTGEISVTDASGTCAVTAAKAGDNNYNPATSVSFTVALNHADQAALSVTGPASVTYGATGTLTSSGGMGTGAVTYSVGASTGCSITGGTTLTVDNASGTCNVTVTKAGDNNYNPITSAPFSVVLNKITPTIAVTNSPVTYNGAARSAVIAGSVPGVASNLQYDGSSLEPIAAATYAVTADFMPTDSDNYNSLTGAPAGNFVIDPRLVTVKADPKMKTAGSADPALTFQVTSGSLAAGDVFSGELGRVAGEGIGTYAILQNTLNLSANYVLTYEGDFLTIVAPLSLTNLDLLQATAQTGPFTAVPGTFAGGFTMQLDPAVPGGFYYLDAANLATNRPLADGLYPFTLTAHPTTGFFEFWAGRGVVEGASGWQGVMWQIINGNQPIFYLRVTGTDYALVDGLQYLTGQGEQPLRVDGLYLLGAYTFSGSVADAFGFTAPVSVNIDFVAPLALTNLDLLQATAQTGPFTAVPGTFAGGFSMILHPAVPGGFYYLDAANLTSNRPLADGLYPFTMSAHPTAGFLEFWASRGVVEGASGWQGVMWQIINGNQPIFYLRVTGTDYNLVDGLQYLTGQGEQPLRVDGLYLLGDYSFNGLVADAYGFTTDVSVGITFVAPTNLTVSGITANNKEYDGNDSAVLVASGAVLNGVHSGDAVNLNTSAAVGVFSDKNVANVKLVTISGLTLDGADALNYTLIQPIAHANITPKELTVAGITAENKIYDGNTAATLNTSSASLVGVVATEDVTLNLADATGVFSDKNVGTVKPVTISGLMVVGADINNYTLTQPETAADITARPLTVNATGINKIYDGNRTASVTLSDNRVASDELTFTYTATFADKDVATAKPVAVTDITISGGADKDNYTLANTTAATTADITARQVTVTADTLNKPFGAMDPSLTYQVTLGNVISGDNFSGALTRDPGEDLGTYAIHQGSLTLGSNYNLTFIGANLTITGFRMWLPIISR